MDGIPEHLIHVAKVKCCCLECVVAKHSLVAHVYSVNKHGEHQETPGYPLFCTYIEPFHLTFSGAFAQSKEIVGADLSALVPLQVFRECSI